MSLSSTSVTWPTCIEECCPLIFDGSNITRHPNSLTYLSVLEIVSSHAYFFRWPSMRRDSRALHIVPFTMALPCWTTSMRSSFGRCWIISRSRAQPPLGFNRCRCNPWLTLPHFWNHIRLGYWRMWSVSAKWEMTFFLKSNDFFQSFLSKWMARQRLSKHKPNMMKPIVPPT